MTRHTEIIVRYNPERRRWYTVRRVINGPDWLDTLIAGYMTYEQAMEAGFDRANLMIHAGRM